MDQLLLNLQQSFGMAGFAGSVAGSGFALGMVAGLLVRRRPKTIDSASPKTAPTLEESTDTATAGSSEKRRNPRRAGRSVEVFVGIAGKTSDPCKGVVLDRSVGGLGLLVGDEYQIGSIIQILPVTASKMTPWVEVEVKSCRKSGEDWELGVQFQKLPPYSTMVLFG